VRILSCTLDYSPGAAGGAEHQAQLQADELARRGHEVHVVCPRRGREKSGQVGAVSVHRLWLAQRKPFQTITTALSLAIFLLRNGRRFDVVHVHLADLRTDVAVIVCGLLRRPVYVKLGAGGPAGDIGKLRRVARLTRYHGLRHAACVQAISAEIELDVARLGIPPARIAAIPNGFDPTAFRPASGHERLAVRRTLGFTPQRPVVLYLGRFAAYKGMDDLLAAWSRIGPAYDAELVLVGFVALEDPFPIPTGLPCVQVRDWTANPAEFYQAADVFVLPSHVEGMSNSLLEAMACGLPVVATSVGAAPEMVRDGVDGLLVPPRDPDALARALSRLLADRATRDALGASARETVMARYSLPAVVDQIEARYVAITQPRPTPQAEFGRRDG
jgi:glycosyltransferase involved in cell wall biosynthesis